MASPATVPRAAGSLLIRPPKSDGQLGSSLPGSEPPVPSCAGSPLPAADAVTAAARPPARPSRQLPPRDVPSCVCACVSKRISSSPSLGAREGPVPGDQLRSGCQSTPSGLSPHPPRPYSCSSSPSFPSSSSSCRSRLPKAGEEPPRGGPGRAGKEAQVSSWERWAHTPERLPAGGGQGFRRRKGRRGFTRRWRSCG